VDLRKWQLLKAKVEAIQKEQEQSKGALKQLMQRLKEDFDCQDINEAKKLLKQLRQEYADGKETSEETLKEVEAALEKARQEK
jgi:predicted transcriptional regulator